MPRFGVAHQTSSPTWTRLREWVARRRPAAVAPAAPVVALAPPRSVAGRVAAEIEETEALADLYARENGQLRAYIADLETELEAVRASNDAAVRERLVGDLARKETERASAVRRADEIERTMTARLEAAERERRECEERAVRAEAAAAERVAEPPAMAKLRAMVDAWRVDGVTAEEVLQRVYGRTEPR